MTTGTQTLEVTGQHTRESGTPSAWNEHPVLPEVSTSHLPGLLEHMARGLWRIATLQAFMPIEAPDHMSEHRATPGGFAVAQAQRPTVEG